MLPQHVRIRALELVKERAEEVHTTLSVLQWVREADKLTDFIINGKVPSE